VAEPVAFIYHDVFDGRGFSRLTESWRRYRLGRQLLRSLALLGPPMDGRGLAAVGAYPLIECRPDPASDADLLRVHTPAYLEFVRAADARGDGFLDRGDTPAWTGLFRRATLAVGGSLLAACLVADGCFRRAFHPAGGLHHARRDRAAGFCPFNDIVIAVRWLQQERGFRRLAIIDLDGHHGDGTQDLLYEEPILTISLHRYDGRFYPGSGAPNEVGRGNGFGFNLNVPLERGTGDQEYVRAFERWVVPALRWYLPELLIVVVGADSHFADPLVRLGLTLNAYLTLARRLAELADDLCGGRIIAVAGGGYAPEHVARCWAVVVGVLANAWQEGDPRLSALLAADQHAARDRELFRSGARPLVERPIR
jgi:acetoin utilization protein AcuC